MTTKVTIQRTPEKPPEEGRLSSRPLLNVEPIKKAYLGSKVDKPMSPDRHLDKEVQYVVPDSKSESLDIAQIAIKLPIAAKSFGYTKGPLIDALKQNCFLCLSGNDLENIAAKESLLSYLRAGGILVLNSDKGYAAAIELILKIIPEYELDNLLTRVFFTTSNGDVLPITKDAKAEELDANKEEKVLFDDHIYLGKIKIERNGDVLFVKNIVDQILNKAKLHPGEIFSDEDTLALLSSARAMPEATKLMADTLEVLKRESINGLIYYSENIINKPIRYSEKRSDKLIDAFSKISPKEESKDEILSYDKLISMSNALQKNLEPEFQTQPLMTIRSLQEQMREQLDSLNLQKGDVIRILEPGNNDQLVAISMAEQVKYIYDYSKEGSLDLDIEVLIMGKGGHATTATFAQFAELTKNEKGVDEFSGTPEAFSLGSTFKKALDELDPGIKTKEVESFKDEADKDIIKIKLAKESKNTGENVKEATLAYDERKVDHIFICSATHQSMRQTQTFAQQYSVDPKDPKAEKKYKTITSIPLAKSAEFISLGLDDFQAVVELYAGLGERARIYLYAYKQNPFIVPEIIDPKELENLYSIYNKLSKTNNLDESKKKSIEDVMKFFTTRFAVMEKAITWSKEKELQVSATQNAMADLAKNYRKKDSFKKAMKLYDNLKGKSLENEDKAYLDKYSKWLKQAKEVNDQAIKYILYSLIGSIDNITKLEEINSRC